ncbi:DUF6875 domain-containing protein [Winslowiella sp. 2C04]|uniref:DUF6875 domain-containing protein n=1 Tax=Winslowiella sp. 2C04 TaxID=3416179 RepID=UPI003CE6A4D5
MVKVINEVCGSAHLKLITINEVINSIETGSTVLSPLQQVAQWGVDYLCNTNPDIGRPGVVCPWSAVAKEKETFWLTELTTRGRKEQDVYHDILSAINCFNQQLPLNCVDTQYKTIVITLPDVNPENKINDLHTLLKPAFLEAGLMLGEFFSTCTKPGLRNSAFHPLRSPIPLLVVREMVEFDIAFLADSKVNVINYLKCHGEKGKTAIRTLLKHNQRLDLSPQKITVLEEVIADYASNT